MAVIDGPLLNRGDFLIAVNEDKSKSAKKKHIFKPTFRLLVSNFFEHDVGRNAAALAYYLLFALFPLLIFISNVLGLLDLNVGAIIQGLQRFLPKDIVNLVGTYLEYVSHTSSKTLLWFALIFAIWFPMRAAKGLMDDVRLAYHLGKPQHPIAYTFRQLVYTIVLLLVIGLTLLLSTVGAHVLRYINNLLPENTLQLSEYLLQIWQYLRFLPIGLLMFAGLGTLYAASMDKRQPIKEMFPGIVAALVLWMIVSIGFSFYVENFADYSIIYGTLGAVIVLLMWLYMTAVILIMGAELNATLKTVRALEGERSLEG